MNQSVYKRDFRYPRDLWKFLLNENLKSNFQYNINAEDNAVGDSIEELSIKRHQQQQQSNESELNNNYNDVARTKSDSCVIQIQQEQQQQHVPNKLATIEKAKSMSSLSNPVNFLEITFLSTE